jgi:cytochrome oxidase Cu insertion factor (SCO1/SenC/PrrC family)
MTTLPSTPQAAPRGRSSLYWPVRFLALVILVLLAWTWFSHPEPPAGSELKKLGVVPPFSLTERSGRNITNQDLLGKIWVADFIFTTCPGPCPLVTAGMAKIQEAVQHDPRVQLVTFTVDPTDDTPAVLAAYADKFGADPYRWWFLTGQEKPLYDLIQNGFYQAVEDNHGQQLQPGQYIVTHSTKLVLVDASGNMRGFYDGVDSDGRAELLADIRTLESEETP